MTDSASNNYSVTTVTAGSIYSFVMKAYAPTVNVTFKDTTPTGTSYACTTDSSIASYWTVDVASPEKMQGMER